jgi:hypothetical protein
MTDTFAEAVKTIQLVAAAVGIAIGLTSLAVSSTGLARQWSGAFRRTTGWMTAGCGLFAVAGGALGWPFGKHQSPARWQDAGLLVVGALGACLCVWGLAWARRAPVDKDTELLRAIADEIVKQLSPTTSTVLAPDGDFIELSATDVAKTDSSKPLLKRLRRERASITIVCGRPGSGKTTAVRELAYRISRSAYNRRRPKLMAAYVDLSTLAVGAEAPTSEQIRDHVLRAVAKDDPAMRKKLGACLNGDMDRANWIFLFDSLDEMAIAWPTDVLTLRMQEFLEAVRRFLRPAGGRFRAVVTTREEPISAVGYPVLVVDPLSRRQQRQLMRAAGLESPARHRVPRRPRYATEELPDSPLPLRLWCDDIARASHDGPDVMVPHTLHEIIAAALQARLRAEPDAGVRAEEMLVIAEQIAFCMATDIDLGRAPSRSTLAAALVRKGLSDTSAALVAMHRLAELRLAIDRPQTFAFAHRSFQDFFATKWLLGGHNQPAPEAVLTDQGWREAAVVALRVGPEQLRSALLSEATRIVDEEISQLTAALVDVTERHASAPGTRLPVLPVIGAATSLTDRLSHVLGLLAEGLSQEPTAVPETIRAATEVEPRFRVMADRG